jgi:hypothetical protein
MLNSLFTVSLDSSYRRDLYSFDLLMFVVPLLALLELLLFKNLSV